MVAAWTHGQDFSGSFPKGWGKVHSRRGPVAPQPNGLCCSAADPHCHRALLSALGFLLSWSVPLCLGAQLSKEGLPLYVLPGGL